MCASRTKTQDRRYRRVEKSIQETVDKMYLSGDFVTKVLEFSTKAEINPASFYAHYRCIGEAIMARDKNMRSDFATCVGKETQKQCPRLEIIFHKMFLFVCKNESYFRALVRRGNVGVFSDVTGIIKPTIIRKWRKYRMWDKKRALKIEEIFYDFSYEIIREFNGWMEKDNFSSDKIGLRVKRLVYFAETACQRLGHEL